MMEISEKLRKLGIISGSELAERIKKEPLSENSSEKDEKAPFSAKMPIIKKMISFSGDNSKKEYMAFSSDLSLEERNELLEFIEDGQEYSNEYGHFWERKKLFAPDYNHGKYWPKTGLEMGPLLELDRNFADIKPWEILFLDIETSGLSGGSGTFAFMISLGNLDEDGAFHFRQFFMRDLEDEQAILCEIIGHLSKFKALSTYNGRSFDVPILESRFLLNGFRTNIQDMPNLDLLHITRKISARTMKNHTLDHAEETFIGFERIGDIPGELVPAAYMDWLNYGLTNQIYQVFIHNELDILSLGILAGLYGKMIEDPERYANIQFYFGLGRIFLENDRMEDGTKLLKEFIDKYESWPAAQYLANSLKKMGLYHKSIKVWENFPSFGPQMVFSLVERAKYCEHKIKDYIKALELTENATNCALSMGFEGEDMLLALKKRQKRLISKIRKEDEKRIKKTKEKKPNIDEN